MEQLIGTLGIDWKIFLGQMFNFLIFLVILRVFAYKPLLGVMEKRQKLIEEGLENAKKQKELVASLEEEKRDILKQAREEAQMIMTQSKEKAESMHAAILQAGKDRAEELLARAQTNIAHEQEVSRAELKEYVGGLAIAISEKILKEHMDAKKEDALIRDMLEKIE